jgi:hypothetical protein
MDGRTPVILVCSSRRLPAPSRGERKGFFFEKKKQKTFLNWARAARAPPAQCKQKFLRRFFQKAATSFPFW